MPMLALTFASAASVALVVARILWTGNLRYSFLVWNLFLAWLPLIFALLACEKYRARLGPELAFPGSGWRLAALLPQRALHLHRLDPPDHALLPPFLGGPDPNPALRAHGAGAGLRVPLPDAVGRGANARAPGQLAFHRCRRGPERFRHLSGPVSALQQLGCPVQAARSFIMASATGSRTRWRI